MLVQFGLSTLVLYLFPRFRPRHEFGDDNTSKTADEPLSSEMRIMDQPSDPVQKPLMTKQFYLTRIGPCAAATGLDIGLGNMSLKFISLTFYSMLSSIPHPQEIATTRMIVRRVKRD